MTVTISRTGMIIVILVAVIVALAAVLLLSGGGEQVSQTAERETAIPAERQSVPVEDDTVPNLTVASAPLLETIERCGQQIDGWIAAVGVVSEGGADSLTRRNAQRIDIWANAVLDCYVEWDTQLAQLELNFPVSMRSAEWREIEDLFEEDFGLKSDFGRDWREVRSNLVSGGLLD